MKLSNWLCMIPLALLLLISLAGGLPDEAMGRITHVVDGDTADVQLQDHDSRITEDLIRIRFADIDTPEMDTPQGPVAKAFTAKWLEGSTVYLDLDDKRGTDPYGRWVAVIYLAGPDGSIDTSKNFNRMLVDAGQACVWDFDDNEFSPADWWPGGIPATACVKGSSETKTPVLTPSIPSSSGDQYVGSTKSDKYHYPSCRWAEKINPSNEIWFSSSEDARAHGYVPCKVCNPP